MRVPLRSLSVRWSSLGAALAFSVLRLSTANAAQPAPPVDVTTCGQVVTGAGRLVADLDCTGQAGLSMSAAIMVRHHGSLDLDGHTLIAGPGAAAVACGALCKDGVNYCEGDCTIYGGTITVPTATGILGRNVMLHDVTVTVNTWGVIASRKLTIMDSTIGGSDYVEVEGRWIKIYRSTLIGSGLAGISTAPRNSSLKLFESTVSGHQCDLSTWRLPRLHDSSCASSCGGGHDGLGPWGVCTDD